MEPFPVGQKSDNDEEFEKFLLGSKGLFLSKKDTMHACTKVVVKICSDSLTASNIRHPPITHRVKTWESTRTSIERRQSERTTRANLRAEFLGQGKRWDDYCRMSGLEPEEVSEPFRNSEQMLSALHDYGGVRISLYFPGDVTRVASILEDKFRVIKRTEKTQRANRSFPTLHSRGNLEAGKTRTAMKREHDRFVKTFNGYNATHFVAKLPQSEIKKEVDRDCWEDVQVEIQIGTLVMHVWSEIEHDMIYKPQELQGGGVTDDEKRVLDLINGIVLTGEAALSQLEASIAKRLNQRAENEKAMASSYYELATWIEKYCETHSVTLINTEWKILDRLYSILKAAGDHQHSKVTGLLEKVIAREGTADRETLPCDILQELCKQSCRDELPLIRSMDIGEMVQNARFWALRLVHNLNLAIYLGVSEQFFAKAQLAWRTPPRPSFLAFLDILHPSQPRYTSCEDLRRIAHYCSVIDKMHESDKLEIKGQLQVAMDLPKTNRILGTAEFDGYHMILVSGMISRLFSNFPHSVMSTETDKPVNLSENDTYRILDAIEYWLPHENTKVDNMLLWDLIMQQRGKHEYNEPTRYRFFVAQPSDSENARQWQLIAHDIELDIVELDLCKEVSIIPSGLINKPSIYDGPGDDLLQLAYRLYPQTQQGDVRKVYSKTQILFLHRLRYQQASKPRKPCASDPM